MSKCLNTDASMMVPLDLQVDQKEEAIEPENIKE
jgi:hypothetical protein